MCTYNRAGHLPATIQSIQAQTYTNWELLVEDDGSTDNTEQVIAKIGDDRIKYTKHDRTAITGKLKNEAFKKAAGAFIAFMDSDDLWDSNKLQLQVALLEQNTDAGFTLCNWKDFEQTPDDGKLYYPETQGIVKEQMFVDYCLGKRLAHIQTVMVRKECIEKAGNFNENRLFTDYSYLSKLANSCVGIFVYEPLLFRRIHAENSVNYSWAEDFIEFQETMMQYVDEGKLDYAIIQEKLFYSCINLGEKFLSVREKKSAIKYYLQAWRHRPLSIIPLKKTIKSLFL